MSTFSNIIIICLYIFNFFMRFRFQTRMFTSLSNISQTNITIITHLLQLNTYKMIIKTKFVEEYVNVVDEKKNRKRKFWICSILLVFILFILTIIQVFIWNTKEYLYKYLNNYIIIHKCIGVVILRHSIIYQSQMR